MTSLSLDFFSLRVHSLGVSLVRHSNDNPGRTSRLNSLSESMGRWKVILMMQSKVCCEKMCTENEQEKIINQEGMGGIHGRLTKFLTYAVIHTKQVNYGNGDDDLLTKTQVTQQDMNRLEEFL